ncbi:MAG: tetratricopeptide repeat protein [Pseudomonadota bacterium]
MGRLHRTASAVAMIVLAVAVVAPSAVAQAPNAAQLSVQLQQLQEEMARLRGEVEALRFRQQQLEQALGGGATSGALAPSAPGSAGDPGLPAAGSTLGGAAAGAGTAIDRPVTTPSAGGMDAGMDLLRAGRFNEARAELDRFVAANPSDPRAPEAAYWSAETLFVGGDYGAAASAFAANYRAYGADAPYAPESLLKVAQSLIELGDRERACTTLDELGRRHPDTGQSLQTAIQRDRTRAGCS